MAALVFDAAPSNGQIFTDGTRCWQWNSALSVWLAFSPVGFGQMVTSIDAGSATVAAAKVICAQNGQLPAALGSNVFSADQWLGNNRLRQVKSMAFAQEIVLAATSGTINIDWRLGSHFFQPEPTGTITYTFNDPEGVQHLQLRMDSDGTSSAQTINLPANVKQYGIAFTMSANKMHILNLYWDAKRYHVTNLTEA